MSKQTKPIKNIRAFVDAYLAGRNGLRTLGRRKPLAVAFQAALNKA